MARRSLFFLPLGSSSVDVGFVCTMCDRVVNESTEKM